MIWNEELWILTYSASLLIFFALWKGQLYGMCVMLNNNVLYKHIREYNLVTCLQLWPVYFQTRLLLYLVAHNLQIGPFIKGFLNTLLLAWSTDYTRLYSHQIARKSTWVVVLQCNHFWSGLIGKNPPCTLKEKLLSGLIGKFYINCNNGRCSVH